MTINNFDGEFNTDTRVRKFWTHGSCLPAFQQANREFGHRSLHPHDSPGSWARLDFCHAVLANLTTTPRNIAVFHLLLYPERFETFWHHVCDENKSQQTVPNPPPAAIPADFGSATAVSDDRLYPDPRLAVDF